MLGLTTAELAFLNQTSYRSPGPTRIRLPEESFSTSDTLDVLLEEIVQLKEKGYTDFDVEGWDEYGSSCVGVTVTGWRDLTAEEAEKLVRIRAKMKRHKEKQKLDQEKAEQAKEKETYLKLKEKFEGRDG